MEIIFTKEKNTLATVEKYEFLRLNAYGKKEIPENISSIYRRRIHDCEYMVMGLYLDGELAAGVYISDYTDSLFIEHLFVKKEFQDSGLRLGRLLLEYVLDSYDEFYEFFRCRTDETKLFATSDKSKSIYEKAGYECDGGTPLYIKKLVKTKRG